MGFTVPGRLTAVGERRHSRFGAERVIVPVEAEARTRPSQLELNLSCAATIRPKNNKENIMPVTKQQALDYHFGGRPGKIEVPPTKPCRTQHDLSLAYPPGVADPCMEIHRNPRDAFKYTGR